MSTDTRAAQPARAGAAWPMAAPPDRDHLAAWTTALLADDPLGRIPPFAEPHPPGFVAQVDARGVYVRRWERDRSSSDGAVVDDGAAAGRSTADRLPADVAGGPTWCIHGLAGSSTNFSRLAGALSPYTTVFSPDLPGCGRSDPPPRGRYSLVGDADLLARVIEQVSGGPVNLVGNSLGGMVAVALAARHPELVRTLTLVSPAVPDLRLTSDRGADPRIALLMIPGTAGLATRQLGTLSPEERARGMGEVCFGDPAAISDEDYAAFAADLAWRGGLPWAHDATIGSLRSLVLGYLSPGRWSFSAAAGRLTVPVLVVWGTRDRLVDVRLARRTAAAFPDARLLVLAGRGHVAQMEDPETTARAMLARWRDAHAEDGSPRAAPVSDAPPNGSLAARTPDTAAGVPRDRGAGAVATSSA